MRRLLLLLFLGLALLALASFGVFQAVEALAGLGPLNVVIDGESVLDGLRLRDWPHEHKVVLSLVIASVLLLILLMLPVIVLFAIALGVLTSLVALLVAFSPLLLGAALVWWLMRRRPAKPQ